jgi:NDP-sugar pyrophosphorylase family protein
LRERTEDTGAMPPVLLLAGGLGTRLRPLTDHTPKCLVPIAGKPLLDYWRQSFERQGIRDVIINVHAHPEQVRDYIEHRKGGPVHWRAFEEPHLLGSAGTLRETLPTLEEAPDFLVIYADNLSDADLPALVRFHRDHDAEFTMALFETPAPSSSGIATLEPTGRIVAFVEKPENPNSNLANAGIYAIRSGVVGPLLDRDSRDIGFDLLPRLVGRMYGWLISGYHRDIGNPQALAQAEADVESGALRCAQEDTK